MSFRSHPKWSQGDQSHPRDWSRVENLRDQPFALNHRQRFNLQPWHDISGKYTAPFYLTCKSLFFQNIAPTSPSVEPFVSPHSFSNTWLLDQLLVFSKLHSCISFLTFFHRPILLIPIRSNSQRAYIYREPANREKHVYFLLRKVSPYFKILINSMSYVVCKKGYSLADLGVHGNNHLCSSFRAVTVLSLERRYFCIVHIF